MLRDIDLEIEELVQHLDVRQSVLAERQRAKGAAGGGPGTRMGTGGDRGHSSLPGGILGNLPDRLSLCPYAGIHVPYVATAVTPGLLDPRVARPGWSTHTQPARTSMGLSTFPGCIPILRTNPISAISTNRRCRTAPRPVGRCPCLSCRATRTMVVCLDGRGYLPQYIPGVSRFR